MVDIEVSNLLKISNGDIFLDELSKHSPEILIKIISRLESTSANKNTDPHVAQREAVVGLLNLKLTEKICKSGKILTATGIILSVVIGVAQILIPLLK